MVKLTSHAKLRIRERNIKLSDVLFVIERPSIVFYDTMTGCNIALAPWKSKSKKWLLISYVLIGKEIKIITLFVLSKPEELTRKREMSGRWLRINQK